MTGSWRDHSADEIPKFSPAPWTSGRSRRTITNRLPSVSVWLCDPGPFLFTLTAAQSLSSPWLSHWHRRLLSS